MEPVVGGSGFFTKHSNNFNLLAHKKVCKSAFATPQETSGSVTTVHTDGQGLSMCDLFLLCCFSECVSLDQEFVGLHLNARGRCDVLCKIKTVSCISLVLQSINSSWLYLHTGDQTYQEQNRVVLYKIEIRYLSLESQLGNSRGLDPEGKYPGLVDDNGWSTRCREAIV